jgi:membrane-bound ClpP family serine protease
MFELLHFLIAIGAIRQLIARKRWTPGRFQHAGCAISVVASVALVGAMIGSDSDWDREYWYLALILVIVYAVFRYVCREKDAGIRDRYIGMGGTVIQAIPERGFGRARIGDERIDARSESGDRIPLHDRVVVVGVVTNTFVNLDEARALVVRRESHQTHDDI